MKMSTVIIFVMAAINIPFIVTDPTRWLNWLSFVFCFGLGIISIIWTK